MNRTWTGKLQVTLLSAYISWNKLCLHSFKASLEEVLVIPSEKMKAKYMKEDVWKRFFCILPVWHLAISVRINFFSDNFQRFLVNEHLWMATSRPYDWILNIFLLYLLVEIQQLVHEISGFPEGIYKKGVLKNVSKFTDKHKKQSSTGVLSKDALKNCAKSTEKQPLAMLCKKGDHKNFANFQGKHLCWSFFFIKLQFWGPAIFFKKRLQNKCFPVKFVKFLKTTILENVCERRIQHRCLVWILRIIQEHLFAENLQTTGSETPVWGLSSIKLEAWWPECL